jgi:hypothetical protein
VEGMGEPLSEQTRGLLRQAVHEHARTEVRRRYPPVLHVGVPGRRVAALELDDAATDPGLRTDVVAALRVRAGDDPDQLVWLTRCGALETQDVDAGWLTAARAAYAEAGAGVPVFVVVNRRGWRDPGSGQGRTWARVRPARRDPVER